MKRLALTLLVLLMLAIPLVSCDTDTPKDTDTDTEAPETDIPSLNEDDEELFIGYGRELLTPYDENGVLIEGYTLAGVAEKRLALSVKNDLYASCTAAKDKDGNVALIYSVDLHSMNATTGTALQTAVSEATGVPADNIIFNATHAHTAITTTDFFDHLAEKLSTCAKTALADLTLVTELYTGTLTIDKMNFTRSYETDKNGTEIAHLWDNDHTMPVIKFVREGKKDVILANWAAHCDTVMSSQPNVISADYVDSFRKTAEEALDAHVTIHLGASGDVNPSSRIAGEARYLGTDYYGKQLANALVDGMTSLERQSIKSSVKSDTNKVRVECDHSDDARGEDATEIMELFWNSGNKLTQEIRTLIKEKGFTDIYDAMFVRNRYASAPYERVTVGAISIGNAVFAFAPYEMFSANGKNVKDSADEFDVAFICSLTNGNKSYIASEEAFAYDTYEVRSRRYVKGTAELLQDAMIAIIDELGK